MKKDAVTASAETDDKPEFRLFFTDNRNFDIRCFEISRQHRRKTHYGKLQVQINHLSQLFLGFRKPRFF